MVSITSIWLNHNMYLYINILDTDTRFLIASKLGKFKDIRQVFEVAKEKTGQHPVRILTDGWKGYGDVIEQVFGADTGHKIIYSLQSRRVPEEFNAFLKNWRDIFKAKFKLMRYLDQNAQMVADGLALGYNYFYPHRGLDGRTPAQAANVGFPYKTWPEIARSCLTI
jgi:hypothetical protein